MTAHEAKMAKLEEQIEMELRMITGPMMLPCFGKVAATKADCETCLHIDACKVQFTTEKELIELGLLKAEAEIDVEAEYTKLTTPPDPIIEVMKPVIEEAKAKKADKVGEAQQAGDVVALDGMLIEVPRQKKSPVTGEVVKLDWAAVVNELIAAKPTQLKTVVDKIMKPKIDPKYKGTPLAYAKKILAKMENHGLLKLAEDGKTIYWA